jgi:integrase/recombinase XerD
MNGRTLTEKRQLYKAHVIGELMYSTGMRVNEVASLKEKDINFYRGIVTVYDSKTGKKREAILNTFAGKVVEIYVNQTRPFVMFGKNNADTALLFGAKTNLRTWLNGILDRESKNLGLGKFTTHNFRHAVGYHLLRGGCDIRFIQEILGHEALHSTQVYTKVDKEDLKNVIDTYHPRTMRARINLKGEELEDRLEENQSDDNIVRDKPRKLILTPQRHEDSKGEKNVI